MADPAGEIFFNDSHCWLARGQCFCAKFLRETGVELVEGAFPAETENRTLVRFDCSKSLPVETVVDGQRWKMSAEWCSPRQGARIW